MSLKKQQQFQPKADDDAETAAWRLRTHSEFNARIFYLRKKYAHLLRPKFQEQAK